jgi:DNA-binding PadR family transcriptional regulator
LKRVYLMNELLVLSLLMHWPLHAYKLAKIANNIIGPEEEISRGTLSSLLAKLEQAGLITPADVSAVPFPSDRPSQVFAITPKGRERFFELMLDTTSFRGAYSRVFRVKTLHLEFLSLEQQLIQIEHYLAYCQHFLHSKEAQKQDFARSPIKQEHIEMAFRNAIGQLMQRKIVYWQDEVAWVQTLRDRVISRLRHPDKEETEMLSPLAET